MLAQAFFSLFDCDIFMCKKGAEIYAKRDTCEDL